jgi:hypothetical protein
VGLDSSLWLLTHALRPFDRLRASCGLYSFAASRLLFSCRLHLPLPSLATANKTSGVITPTAGARSRAIRVCCLAPWLSDVPGCPSLTWGGCGGREFPRTCASLHPGPTFARMRELKFSVKVVRHSCKINFCGKAWQPVPGREAGLCPAGQPRAAVPT